MPEVNNLVSSPQGRPAADVEVAICRIHSVRAAQLSALNGACLSLQEHS
jgi:hypothetical protein